MLLFLLELHMDIEEMVSGTKNVRKFMFIGRGRLHRDVSKLRATNAMLNILIS